MVSDFPSCPYCWSVFSSFLFPFSISSFLISLSLVLLSATVKSLKNISKEFLDLLTKNTEEEMKKENISDQDHYVLNHKLDVIKDIKI